MTSQIQTALDVTRITGLIARAASESNSRDFIAALYELRRRCDIAIQQHTFRIVDIVETADDDDL